MDLAGKSFLKKGANVFMSNWVVIFIQFVLGILIVRFLGAKGKGEVSVIQAGAGLLAALLSLGLNNASGFYLKRGIYDERTLFITVSKIIAAVVAVFALLLVFFYHQIWAVFFSGVSNEALYAAIAAYVAVMIFTQYFASVYLAKADVKIYRIFTVGSSILYMVFFGLFVIFLKQGVLGVVLSYMLGELLLIFWAYSRVRQHDKVASADKSVYKALLGYGLKSHMVLLGNLLFARLDLFFIAMYLHITDVGIYSVAAYFYTAGLTIPTAINGMLVGEVAKDSKKSVAIIMKSVKAIGGIMLVAVVLGLFTGKYFIILLYGKDFIAAVPSLNVLLVSALIMAVSTPLQAYFLGIGKPQIPGVITISGGVVKVLFLVILIPMYGIVGNAWATLISVCVIALLRVGFFYKKSRETKNEEN